VRPCQPGYELVGGICVQPGGGPNVDAEASGSCSVGNPVAINTGDKRLVEVDHLPASGSHLAFVRYYNALPIRARAPFSARWLHTYSGWIDELGDPPWAYVFRPNGGMRWLGNLNAPIVNGRQRWTMTWGYNEQLFKLFDAANKPTGWQLIDTDGSVETYDTGGRLKTITKSDGTLLTLSYSNGNRATGVYVDDAGNPTTKALPVGVLTQVEGRGRWLKFHYVEPLKLRKLTTSENLEYRYGTDALGNPTSVTYPDGSQRQYVYNETSLTGGVSLPYALTGLIDERAARLGSYTYDSSGRATQSQRWADMAQTRPAGPYGLAHATSSTTVTNGVGASHVYTYALVNGRRVLTSVSQPGGAGCGPSSASLTYDANANVSSRTDFNGQKSCFAYDLSRNLETRRVEGVAAAADCATALTSPPTGSRVISTQWHPDWRVETKVAEPNKITTITYNGQGATCAPTTVLVDGKPPAVVCSRSEQATTDATGALGFSAGLTGTARTWTYTYTTYGRVLTATDPNGKTTTTSYYPDDDPDMGRRGNVATITNAANHVTRITAYNLHGQPTQIVDPNGLVTDLTYDLRLRLTSRKVGSELTTFTYDPRGLLTNVALPDGASLTYSYDVAHRLIAIADQQGSRVDYTLDAMGNRISERATDNGGTLVRNIQRSIDALNRVQQITGAN
jgi:YD repeat-containing protein